MEDHRLPKIVLYGELSTGHRNRGAPKKRLKDSLKKSLSSCNIENRQWSVLVTDRAAWRINVHDSVSAFERRRRTALEDKRSKRKNTRLVSRHLPGATVAEYAGHASDLSVTSGCAAGERRAPDNLRIRSQAKIDIRVADSVTGYNMERSAYSSRIRLVGGSGPNEGRVEVRPSDSFRWGTVCKNGFDLKDAEVVCRMLGYANVFTVRSYAYLGTGPIHLDNLQCDGTESSLFNCSHKGWGIHDCEHRDDVGVVCGAAPYLHSWVNQKPKTSSIEEMFSHQEKERRYPYRLDHSRIRLVGGSSRKEGRVEVRPADSMTWGTVCHNQFDMKDADVVCKMLGYPSALQVRKNAYFGPGRGPVYMDDLQCNGNENSLFNCSYPGWTIHDSNCNHDQDVGVGCTGMSFVSYFMKK
ncbi:PREDICTED: scavenger receptor cysteine-rich domain-containing group B protein-like [Branchiostoma belcheri]|uniref:Soluble scavenger receptor cysteine-rich domain-containing protein SSC5D n=1 Tax=Branchiostoma belcheri TaxID=7741 RepID=A0A6P4XRG4_BRABE|nr:PREDICTED: scavenger receptor cysteine-rich domain-containing group B protein-like [Branchiostoma belcheri]